MYLKRGFHNTIQAIKRHKTVFISLIVLQLIILILFSYLIVTYQVKILENSQEITQALQEANYNPDSIQAGEPFLKDIALVYNNYNSMMDDIGQLILWLLGIFILFNGLIWILTHYILKKTNLIQTAIKFIASTIVLLGPITIVFYIILTKYVTTLALTWKILLIVFAIVYYFLLVSFAFLNIKSWKKFVKRIFILSIKKIHWTLLVLIINLILIAISIASIYYTINIIYLNMIFMLLFATILIITKIFWISCLNEKNNH
tara:strand:- start:327 stop:1106 length:780 start_codon:yes stop_codon:yes gene_type:complete